MTEPNECCMESRIVKLEAEHDLLKDDMNNYYDALKENTHSINELCKTMIRHDEILKEQSKDSATRNAIITGVAVGIVVMFVDGLIHLI